LEKPNLRFLAKNSRKKTPPITRNVNQIFCRYISVRYNPHPYDRQAAESQEKDEITSGK